MIGGKRRAQPGECGPLGCWMRVSTGCGDVPPQPRTIGTRRHSHAASKEEAARSTHAFMSESASAIAQLIGARVSN